MKDLLEALGMAAIGIILWAAGTFLTVGLWAFGALYMLGVLT